MKTLIVDDEPIARRVLREELETFPEIEIVGGGGKRQTGAAKDRGSSSRIWCSSTSDAGDGRV